MSINKEMFFTKVRSAIDAGMSARKIAKEAKIEEATMCRYTKGKGNPNRQKMTDVLLAIARLKGMILV